MTFHTETQLCAKIDFQIQRLRLCQALITYLLLMLFSILITFQNHVSLLWQGNVALGKTAFCLSPDTYKGPFQQGTISSSLHPLPPLWCFVQ